MDPFITWLFNGLETVTTSDDKLPREETEVKEMKMCKWACGHTVGRSNDNSDYPQPPSIQTNFRERISQRGAGKQDWGGLDTLREETKNTSKEILEMVLPGRRKRGRLKQRWLDCVNRDMRAIAIGIKKMKVHDKTGWRRIVSAV